MDVMAEASGGSQSDNGPATNQLASLVPTFDPSVDQVESWGQKIELLLHAWPENRLKELATRIVLNTKGSAFQKLQLKQAEILTGTAAGVRKIVEVVGGQFGQVELERKYELVEKALYKCIQKADETADSFLARSDNAWTELLMKKVQLAEIQAYIILRGSRLTHEDKKRVLVEAGAETGSSLDMQRVSSAVRMLGSGFFQEYTGAKKEKGMKTYDQTAFAAEDATETGEIFASNEDWEDESIEAFAADDEDSTLCQQFEQAILDSVQEDQELATFFSSYQAARQRLLEKSKARGFWNPKGGKSFGKKGFKGKGKSWGAKSLAQRISESTCRKCFQKGHWKAECPLNKVGGDAGASSSLPTSTVIELSNVLTDIPEISEEVTWHEVHWVQDQVSKGSQFANQLKTRLSQIMPRKFVPSPSPIEKRTVESKFRSSDIVENPSLFCSVGSTGVVDLGASQTVIGSEQVADLLKEVPQEIRKQVRRQAVNLTFRFGNHQTLKSTTALYFPLQGSWFRVAIVPGPTPFLLSRSFLKQIKAVVDADKGSVWSKTLGRFMDCSTSEKDLVMMNINSLWKANSDASNCCEMSDASEALQVQHDEQNSSHDQTECNVAKTVVKDAVELRSCGSSRNTMNSCQSHVRQRVAEIEACQRKIAEKSKLNMPRPQPSPSSDRDSSCSAESHVVGKSVEGLSSGIREVLSRTTDRTDDTGSAVRMSCGIRQDQDGIVVPGGIRRLELDAICDQSLREQPEARAQEIRQVCPTHDRCRRESTVSLGQEACVQTKGEASLIEDARTAKDPGDFRAVDGRAMAHLRDRATGRSATSAVCQRAAHEGNRRHVEPSSLAPSAADREHELIHREHECFQGEVFRALKDEEQGQLRDEILMAKMLQSPERYEFDFLASDVPETFARQCRKLTQKFRQELADVMKTVKPNGKRTLFFEVMCSPDSELTRQCQSMGYLARRFGLAEGDLKSRIGRRNLFAHLVSDCPMHLWYAPICKPWCKWSSFNMSRSEDSFERIMQERLESMWQISLAIVLFEYQCHHERHFHMEQPEGSAMLHLPMLGKILAVARPCVFDMCNVGHLREPISQTPIRKRLIVHTTSGTLRENLDKRFCRGDHEHHIIAGSTRINSEVVAVSKFTERYPRKFARQIVQLLSHGSQKPAWLLAADEDGEDDHPTKRRRVDQKRIPWQIALRDPNLTWSHVLIAADAVAPRVGVKVIETGELMEAAQTLCPNHIIQHLVLCRGTDRMVGPNKRLSPGEAPFRRMICIRRRFEDHETETEWEPWERLSFRKLRRNCTPARLNVTIYARPRYEPLPELRGPLGNEAQHRRLEDPPQEPNPKVRRIGNIDQDPSMTREIIDLASQKHGPLMQALKTDEQAWLLKLHRNLGHPGSQKLMTFCRQLQCEERVIKAIPDLKCSTCQETKGPTIPRPSAIHEDHDFGDVVSMDGQINVVKSFISSILLIRAHHSKLRSLHRVDAQQML